MESTGVDASIPETESVDASSFVQASQKVPGDMLEAGTHRLSVGTQKLGRNMSLFSCCCSFCVGFAGRACGSGARCRRPFLSSYFRLLGPVWCCLPGSVPSLFRETGRRPKNRSLAGNPPPHPSPLWRQWHWLTALRNRWYDTCHTVVHATPRYFVLRISLGSHPSEAIRLGTLHSMNVSNLHWCGWSPTRLLYLPCVHEPSSISRSRTEAWRRTLVTR